MDLWYMEESSEEFLVGWLYCRIKKLKFLEYFDLMMPSIALAQGFGRIGCFLAGCCYGKETSGPLAVTFTNSDFAPNNVALIPTQILFRFFGFVHFSAAALCGKA